MERKIDNRTIPQQKGTITKNPALDRIFGGRILFPEKNRLAEEQIEKYGLPKELNIKENAD